MKIEHQQDTNRYVLIDNDAVVGEVEYDRQGQTLSLVRAEVPVQLRGQGLGAALVRGTLEAIRDEGGLTITPICPYIAKFIMKNKEFRELVA